MRWALVCACVLFGCGGQTSSSSTTTDAALTDTATGAATDAGPTLRSTRYCEIFVGFVSGENLRIDVYNTIGLNDCPEPQWKALDAAALKAERKADVVDLNGPRFWTVDAFEGSSFLDGTVVDFGGLGMRKAGQIDLLLSDALAGSAPYVPRNIKRNTTMLVRAGQRVYELVDPTGRVFVMQSWSDQKTVQTEASLESLGDRLKPTAGWRFRTRVLTADLRLVAAGGLASVVQDDFANSYFLSNP